MDAEGFSRRGYVSGVAAVVVVVVGGMFCTSSTRAMILSYGQLWNFQNLIHHAAPILKAVWCMGQIKIIVSW
jgi:hypothetical protein